MEMPALLPLQLESYRRAQTEEDLFNQLNYNRNDLIAFFLVAADDETWSENHPRFMQKILSDLTQKSLQGRLFQDELKKIQQKIHEHGQVLASHMPMDIVFIVKGKEFLENSLFFGALSPVLYDSIRNQCSATNSNIVIIENLSLETFQVIKEFAKTGEVRDLWKTEQNELKTFRKAINSLKITELEILSENILTRYIDRTNALKTMIEAHLAGWATLRQAAYDTINSLDLGVQFHKSNLNRLSFEFLDFKENALSLFAEVKHLITDLIVRKNLTESSEFSDCLYKLPSLIQLNISLSTHFSDRILDAEDALSELDVSSCSWLNINALSRIIDKFPQLTLLNLSDNTQLNYNAWGKLLKLKALNNLDISRNVQIHDEDFKLILHSVPQLTDLNCADCKNIGDAGFFELAKSLSHLLHLNMENSQISDGLLIELAAKSPYLEEINLSKCSKISDRGILEFVRQAKALKKVIICGCTFKETTLHELKRQKSYVAFLT